MNIFKTEPAEEVRGQLADELDLSDPRSFH